MTSDQKQYIATFLEKASDPEDRRIQIYVFNNDNVYNKVQLFVICRIIHT